MERAISKISKEFPNRVLTGINACLRARSSISATILICCAIDLFSKYFTGEEKSSKTNYIKCLTHYFPQYADSESFYKFIRCGLLHSYNLDRKYIIINSNQQWAQELHMKLSPKHKMIIINPRKLKKDLKNAISNFIQDVSNNKVERKKLRKIYKQYPLEGQTMKISKFKYLLEEKS